MKKTLIVGGLVLIYSALWFLQSQFQSKTNTNTSTPTTATQTIKSQSPNLDKSDVLVLAENLDTPWEIVFITENSLLITERQGTVKLIEDINNISNPIIVGDLNLVKEVGEGGLLGMTMHPDFNTNNYIYFYYTYSSNNTNTLNRVVRMTFKDNKLSNEEIIVNAIPGASNHNGGRIKFGPDKNLYITTGDAQEPSRAQDKNSLAGKILRVTDNGKAATGNPFNNLVFSYGHRNPQGLAWVKNSKLWSTEHGRSGVQSGLDELNIIEAGKNYGWPTIQGNQEKDGMQKPELNSGSTTWAPAGMAFINDKLYFAGLRGETLYSVNLNENNLQTKEYFASEYGRIRAVVSGPDGMLYISTSNKDGRGNPDITDDKILRINPSSLN